MNQGQGTRLDSWKAIAAYLGRDVSTAIRWEKEKGLPVHRLPGGKRQAVFALTHEIDAWLMGQDIGQESGQAEPVPEIGPAEAAPPSAPPPPVVGPAVRRPPRWLTASLAAVAATVLALVWAGSAGSLGLPGEGFQPIDPNLPAFARHDIPLFSSYTAASADLNGDGFLDLVVTAYRANLLHVFVGAGDGTFRHRAAFPTGIKPDGVVLADFDGDGAIDAATGNRDSNTVSVFRGKGDATFHPRVDRPVGEGPRGLAAGDLDGDRRADLVVADYAADTITLFRSAGASLDTRARHPAGAEPYQIRAADLDADGVVDLVVGNANHEVLSRTDAAERYTLLILRGTGDGTFVPRARYLVGEGASGMAVADLDTDGHLDLAVAGFEQNVCFVLAGRGDGTFDAPVALPTGAAPLDVVAGDFDGDGRLDLVTANAHAKTVSLLRGRHDNTFAAKLDFPVNSYPKSLVAGDFNGDHALDLVVTNFLDNSISVLLNTTRHP